MPEIFLKVEVKTLLAGWHYSLLLTSMPPCLLFQTIASRRLIATPVVSTTTGRPPQEGRAPPFGAMGEPSPRSPPTLAGPLPFAPQIFH